MRYMNTASNESAYDYPERRESGASNASSTVAKTSAYDHRLASTLESRLRSGGLTGLQNLGNTVTIHSLVNVSY